MGEQMKLDELAAARLEVQAQSAARERLLKLFDEGTFVETDAFVKSGEVPSGVITGYGECDGAVLFAFSQDVLANDGAVGKAQAKKITRLYDTALKTGAPIVGIYDSKGADVSEGNEMLLAYAGILEKAATLSGVVPQISLVLGVCGGVSAMAACTADFLVMSKDAQLFITPPATSLDSKASGTAQAALEGGVAHLVCDDEATAIQQTRQLLSLLPQNNLSAAATFEFAPPADTAALVRAQSDVDAVSMCDLVKAIVDEGSFLRLSNNFGKGAHTSLGTLSGYSVGLVATSGQLDHNGAARIARFVSVCDSFQIPVITLLNTAGVVPSGAAELAGSIRDMARLGQVYAEATTPKVALITGEGVGSAYVALGSADITLAWPGASVSAMPISAAVAFLKSGEITAEKTREQVEAEYKANDASAYRAAECGLVSDILAPADTREALIRAMDMLSGKRVSRLPKKHANLPM